MHLLGAASAEAIETAWEWVREANSIWIEWTWTTSQPVESYHWSAGTDKRWEYRSVKRTVKWYCACLCVSRICPNLLQFLWNIGLLCLFCRINSYIEVVSWTILIYSFDHNIFFFHLYYYLILTKIGMCGHIWLIFSSIKLNEEAFCYSQVFVWQILQTHFCTSIVVVLECCLLFICMCWSGLMQSVKWLDIFSLSSCPHQLLVSPSLLSSGYWIHGAEINKNDIITSCCLHVFIAWCWGTGLFHFFVCTRGQLDIREQIGIYFTKL